MGHYTKIHDKFEYHIEDLDCYDCKFYIRKSKKYKTGCHERFCRFGKIRQEALKNKRIKRKPGHFKIRLP